MELTALALWLNTAFAPLDEAAAIAVHRLFELAGGLFTPLMIFISALGKWGLCLIALGFVLVFFRRSRKMGTALLLGLLVGLLFTNLVAKPLVARPRPYSWEGSVFQQFWIDAGQHRESDKSFPSGHMTAAMAASMAVFLTGDKRKSWLAFLFAIAMGISRIYLGVHYTSDVLGAVVTGGVGGVIGAVAAVRLPEAWYEADLQNFLPGGLKKGRHQKVRRR